jgi:hypothetical protein
MKESITTLRKWNLIAGGIDPINDVIPASVGYGLEEGLQFAVSEISRLEDRIKRLEEAGDEMEKYIHDQTNTRFIICAIRWREAREAKL